MKIENEEKHEIISLNEKVGQLQTAARTLVIILAVILLLNGATLYMQISKVATLSEGIGQQSVRIDDLIMNISNLTDNSIGTTTEIGNVKQDIATVINMLRDTEFAANQLNSSKKELKSPLHVQFSCVNDGTDQAIDPCTVNVEILEITPVDEFILQSGQIMEVIPEKIRLSVSTTVQGYAVYSNIFEYIENGQVYPVVIRLKKN